jgi:hypothetical protein
MAYPSKNIAYQAAGMITSIVEALTKHNELRFTPAFMWDIFQTFAMSRTNFVTSVYSLFSALIMHVYQMRSSNQSIVHTTQQRLTTCMNALKDVSRVWLVAKMVHTLFDSILGNKVLEERLQRAAGKRHGKPKNMQQPKNPLSRSNSDQQKRKFDDMEFGYSGGPPAAQMSYERSRPQSPVNAPREHPPPSGLPGSNASPSLRQDAFMGTSRTNTRPTTPFNTYSYPGTPPDLFLHTRTSPNISQDLWQNYQPDQLFPPDTTGMFPTESPIQQATMVDPALRGSTGASSQQTYANSAQQPPQFQQPAAAVGLGTGMMNAPPQPQQQYQVHLQNPYGQIPDNGEHQQRASMDDTWSNNSGSTGGGPIVPTTLNVGDWFEFFGIPTGDATSLHIPHYWRERFHCLFIVRRLSTSSVSGSLFSYRYTC